MLLLYLSFTSLQLSFLIPKFTSPFIHTSIRFRILLSYYKRRIKLQIALYLSPHTYIPHTTKHAYLLKTINQYFILLLHQILSSTALPPIQLASIPFLYLFVEAYIGSIRYITITRNYSSLQNRKIIQFCLKIRDFKCG